LADGPDRKDVLSWAQPVSQGTATKSDKEYHRTDQIE